MMLAPTIEIEAQATVDASAGSMLNSVFFSYSSTQLNLKRRPRHVSVLGRLFESTLLHNICLDHRFGQRRAMLEKIAHGRLFCAYCQFRQNASDFKDLSILIFDQFAGIPLIDSQPYGPDGAP